MGQYTYLSRWWAGRSPRRCSNFTRPAQLTLFGFFEAVHYQAVQQALPLRIAEPRLAPAVSAGEEARMLLAKYIPSKRPSSTIAIVGGYPGKFEEIKNELNGKGHLDVVHVATYRKRKVNIPSAGVYVVLTFAGGGHSLVAQVQRKAATLGVKCVRLPWMPPRMIADKALSYVLQISSISHA